MPGLMIVYNELSALLDQLNNSAEVVHEIAERVALRSTLSYFRRCPAFILEEV